MYFLLEDGIGLRVKVMVVVLSPRYLHVAGQTYGRPIAGQYEVSATAAKSRGNLWQAMVCVSV